MTVKELIAHLQTFSPDAEVIYRLYSDYHDLEREQVSLVSGVRKSSADYIMDAPDEWRGTMSAEDRANIKPYVCFPGN